MSHLADKHPNGLEWMAIQIRAARHRRIHITMDDFLTAIDRTSGEPFEHIFNKALDVARERQRIEGTL
jgi:hypothetical protein